MTLIFFHLIIFTLKIPYSQTPKSISIGVTKPKSLNKTEKKINEKGQIKLVSLLKLGFLVLLGSPIVALSEWTASQWSLSPSSRLTKRHAFTTSPSSLSRFWATLMRTSSIEPRRLCPEPRLLSVEPRRLSLEISASSVSKISASLS